MKNKALQEIAIPEELVKLWSRLANNNSTYQLKCYNMLTFSVIAQVSVEMHRNRFLVFLVFFIVSTKLIKCFNIQQGIDTVKFLTSPLTNLAGKGDGGLLPTLSPTAKPMYYGEDIAIQKLYSDLTRTKTDIRFFYKFFELS